jgi:hypothetical protein
MFAFILTAAIMAQAADAPQVSSQTSRPAGPRSNVEVVGPSRQPRICRIERGTGSRVNVRRVCQTQAEREAEIAESQRDIEHAAAVTWDRQQGDRPLNEIQQQSLNAYRSNGSPH